MRPPSLLPLRKTAPTANGYREYDIGEDRLESVPNTREATSIAPGKTDAAPQHKSQFIDLIVFCQ
jgi:hypothetical protein